MRTENICKYQNPESANYFCFVSIFCLLFSVITFVLFTAATNIRSLAADFSIAHAPILSMCSGISKIGKLSTVNRQF